MTTIVDIQQAVRSLPDDGFEAFSAWFEEYEEERWDREIQRDQSSGPLRALMERARADFKAGRVSPL